MIPAKPFRAALAALGLLAVSACAGGAYTGPVEVTRFVSDQPAGLGEGTIALRFSETLKNEAARDAFRAAIGDELSLLGYTVIANEDTAGQIARIETSRNPIAQNEKRNPVSVGVGGSTGSFGTGLGVGVGINLGGSGNSKPRVVSELSMAIARNPSEPGGQNLWEGRAQFPTSIDSPYAPLEANARSLAAALFRNFPGGDGETVSIEVSELEQP